MLSPHPGRDFFMPPEKFYFHFLGTFWNKIPYRLVISCLRFVLLQYFLTTGIIWEQNVKMGSNFVPNRTKIAQPSAYYLLLTLTTNNVKYPPYDS